MSGESLTTTGVQPDCETVGRARSHPAVGGLVAAALFGASTPVVKLLVPGVGVLTLAGLLYLGAGLGLSAAALARRRGAEAALERSDLGRLIVVVLAGGVTGPVLLVLGLHRLSGSAASILLNLETPFTILLAVLVLREQLAPREALGAAGIVLAAAVLTWSPGPVRLDAVGAAYLAAACAAWAIDNASSQRLAIRDPIAVGRVKTLAAGAFNLSLSLVAGERLPSFSRVAAALATGLLGYGLSIVLQLRAVRALGAARQAAFFATAPFIGAAVAIPLLGERLSPVQLVAGTVMAAAVWTIVRARHGHLHTHGTVEHAHAHVHDEHHAHRHEGPVAGPHAHAHRHEQLTHQHAHLPDVHHRHEHRPE